MSEILVTRSSMPTIQEYIEEINEMWDSHRLTNMGPKHNKLRDELKAYLGVPNIDLLVNGHMALELTLQAMKLHGEVITTPFTFASTIHAIVRNGLEPVFCDIEDQTYTLDTSKIESLITDRTCAILPVHVYGNICNVDEIARIANKYELKVVYDAAHAFGEKVGNKGIGIFGDASIFSFHATKVFNTIEGGAVCYSDSIFGKELYKLKNFGIRDEETVDGVGANAKMNEFCAAMGLCNLKHIENEIQKRKKIVEHYDTLLRNVDGIKVNNRESGVCSNYAYYPIIIDEKKFGSSRNEIYQALKKSNILARKYFYPLANEYDCFHGKYYSVNVPCAKYISRRVLTLPLYADLNTDQVDTICKTILELRKA